MRRFEKELYPFIETNYPNVMKTLREKKAIDDGLRDEMKKALDAFKETFKASMEAAKADKAAAGKTAADVAEAPRCPEARREGGRALTAIARCPHFSIIGGAFVP